MTRELYPNELKAAALLAEALTKAQVEVQALGFYFDGGPTLMCDDVAYGKVIATDVDDFAYEPDLFVNDHYAAHLESGAAAGLQEPHP